MKEKKTTKLCRHCKTEIPAGAKVCPNCKKKQGGIVKWIIICVVAIAVIGSATGNPDSQKPSGSSTANESESLAEQETASQTSVDTDSEDPLGFNVVFSSTYRNDTTGNWRLARIAENINIEEYALDYYNNYFKADNEVHIIVNFTLNTTTRITVMGNLLDVSILEYVDKEEHDAKIACSGMLLSEYHVNIETGEIEQIQIE